MCNQIDAPGAVVCGHCRRPDAARLQVYRWCSGPSDRHEAWKRERGLPLATGQGVQVLAERRAIESPAVARAMPTAE